MKRFSKLKSVDIIFYITIFLVLLLIFLAIIMMATH